jgi:tRNA1(Val) A37 N6-methylase TrmN6
VSDGEAETTCDAILGGRLTLRQPRAGYRAGLDAALLAAAVELKPGERALEAGCGVGAALLQVAARAPEAALVGVERDPAALALAQANIADNGMAARVSAVEGDVAARFSSPTRPSSTTRPPSEARPPSAAPPGSPTTAWGCGSPSC